MTDDPNEVFEFIDAAEMVREYRAAVEHRDAATTPEQFTECDARALLRRWAEYNGGDIMELHAVACGGPWQD